MAKKVKRRPIDKVQTGMGVLAATQSLGRPAQNAEEAEAAEIAEKASVAGPYQINEETDTSSETFGKNGEYRANEMQDMAAAVKDKGYQPTKEEKKALEEYSSFKAAKEKAEKNLNDMPDLSEGQATAVSDVGKGEDNTVVTQGQEVNAPNKPETSRSRIKQFFDWISNAISGGKYGAAQTRLQELMKIAEETDDYSIITEAFGSTEGLTPEQAAENFAANTEAVDTLISKHNPDYVPPQPKRGGGGSPSLADQYEKDYWKENGVSSADLIQSYISAGLTEDEALSKAYALYQKMPDDYKNSDGSKPKYDDIKEKIKAAYAQYRAVNNSENDLNTSLNLQDKQAERTWEKMTDEEMNARLEEMGKQAANSARKVDPNDVKYMVTNPISAFQRGLFGNIHKGKKYSELTDEEKTERKQAVGTLVTSLLGILGKSMQTFARSMPGSTIQGEPTETQWDKMKSEWLDQALGRRGEAEETAMRYDLQASGLTLEQAQEAMNAYNEIYKNSPYESMIQGRNKIMLSRLAFENAELFKNQTIGNIMGLLAAGVIDGEGAKAMMIQRGLTQGLGLIDGLLGTNFAKEVS